MYEKEFGGLGIRPRNKFQACGIPSVKHCFLPNDGATQRMKSPKCGKFVVRPKCFQ